LDFAIAAAKKMTKKKMLCIGASQHLVLRRSYSFVRLSASWIAGRWLKLKSNILLNNNYEQIIQLFLFKVKMYVQKCDAF